MSEERYSIHKAALLAHVSTALSACAAGRCKCYVPVAWVVIAVAIRAAHCVHTASAASLSALEGGSWCAL
jgi:hypothetical protein